MDSAETVEFGELVRVDLGDEVEHTGLDVVHLRVVGKRDPVVLYRALLESREAVQHSGAVIGPPLVLVQR